MNEAALPQSTVHIAQADPDGILLVIHAGAGNRGKRIRQNVVPRWSRI